MNNRASIEAWRCTGPTLLTTKPIHVHRETAKRCIARPPSFVHRDGQVLGPEQSPNALGARPPPHWTNPGLMLVGSRLVHMINRSRFNRKNIYPRLLRHPVYHRAQHEPHLYVVCELEALHDRIAIIRDASQPPCPVQQCLEPLRKTPVNGDRFGQVVVLYPPGPTTSRTLTRTRPPIGL